MPLKLNVGVTRKIGLPNYGSAGASCYLEAEVDGSLIFADLSVFQKQVQQAFEACRRAVNDELVNHGGTVCHGNRSARFNGWSLNGADAQCMHGCERTAKEPPAATDRQINYARDLACQIPGLGIEQIDAVAEKMFGKPVAELTAPEASRFIEVLQDTKLGNPRVQDVLNNEFD